jgi:hypothetical protein
MTKLREDTKTELEFSKLLQELRNLKLYDLSSRISTAFYDQSLEQFLKGSEISK